MIEEITLIILLTQINLFDSLNFKEINYSPLTEFETMTNTKSDASENILKDTRSAGLAMRNGL